MTNSNEGTIIIKRKSSNIIVDFDSDIFPNVFEVLVLNNINPSTDPYNQFDNRISQHVSRRLTALQSVKLHWQASDLKLKPPKPHAGYWSNTLRSSASGNNTLSRGTCKQIHVYRLSVRADGGLIGYILHIILPVCWNNIFNRIYFSKMTVWDTFILMSSTYAHVLMNEYHWNIWTLQNQRLTWFN